MPTNRQISSHLLMVESCSNLLKSSFHGTCTRQRKALALRFTVKPGDLRTAAVAWPTPLVHVVLKPHGAKMRSCPSSFDCIVLLHVVSWNLLAPAVAMQVFHMNSSADAQRESDSAAGDREYHKLDAVHRKGHTPGHNATWSRFLQSGVRIASASHKSVNDQPVIAQWWTWRLADRLISAGILLKSGLENLSPWLTGPCNNGKGEDGGRLSLALPTWCAANGCAFSEHWLPPIPLEHQMFHKSDEKPQNSQPKSYQVDSSWLCIPWSPHKITWKNRRSQRPAWSRRLAEGLRVSPLTWKRWTRSRSRTNVPPRLAKLVCNTWLTWL